MNEEQDITELMRCFNCKHYENKICILKNQNVKETHTCIDFIQESNLTLKQYQEIQKEKEYENKEISKATISVHNTYDNVALFHKHNPFFYDTNKIFWMWNKTKYCYEIVDETDIMLLIDKSLSLQGQTITNRIKAEYIESFKRIGRENKPKDAPKKWVQFKDLAYSIKSGRTHLVKPNYFFTNPINWEIGKTTETPIMDKLFTEWVGKENKQALYELLAYCCYSSYPIQLLFCLWGNGRNGKSQFLKILDKFIGSKNTTTTQLDRLLTNRFEPFKLYKKLVCLMGETNFGKIEDTDVLKKLVGGDKFGFEKKNKDPFDDYNHAKIIVASNSLPTTSDNSDAFFRRWFIIDFPNEFEDNGQEVWEQVPESEYENLAKKVCEILPELLSKGRFTNQGNIQQQKEKYISVSNPLSQFIEENCVKDFDGYVLYNKLYTEYVKYLAKHKRRRVKSKEFKSALEDEGYYTTRTTHEIDGQYQSGYYIEGLRLKEGVLDYEN